MGKRYTGRALIMCAVVLAVFVLMIARLYTLQVVKHDDYVQDVENKSRKNLMLTGMRGTIYDANMIPIAYDERSYNVQFYRDPSQTSEEARRNYTRIIYETILLLESNGKTTLDPDTEFWLKKDAYGFWQWNLGTTSETVAATREKQWRANFYVSSAEKYPVGKLFDVLCDKYLIDKDMDEAYKLKILAIWQASRMNNYNSTPVTIAYDVGFETVAELEVRAMDLDGMSISESSTRVYPFKSLAAHAIGYISRITTSNALDEFKEKGYPADALVGATGIEYSMEDQLSPYMQARQGEKTVEINTRGAVIRDISYVAPRDGNSIVLTLDTALQAVAAEALDKNIAKIHAEQYQILNALTDEGIRWNRNNAATLAFYAENGYEVSLAETGALVAMNPNNGKVLALVSSPTFDLSIFQGTTVDPGGWSEIVNDSRNPMFNRAVSAKDTPGSIFKLVTSLGGLSEGALTLTETIDDGGEFYEEGTDTSYRPRCWIADSKRYQHANQTIVEGIKNSCNFFFYTVAYRMGTTNITKWAAALGLTTKTNIELPSESTSFVGNQSTLYDPSRTLAEQYTEKPRIAAAAMRKLFLKIAADRGVEYDDDQLDYAVKAMLDITSTYETKSEWYAPIREVMQYDLGIPRTYIGSNLLVNEIVTYLNDLKWTPAETIMAGIGQSVTQVTPIAVARYVSAIANYGTVYDAQIIDKVIDADGNVVLDKQPVITNQIVTKKSYFDAIHEGMKEVTSGENNGTAAEQFANAKYPIAAKTGTSQRTDLDLENNAWLCCYAPVEDPQIVVVVYIQNGYAGARAADAAIKTIEYYLDSLKYTETNRVAAENTLSD